MTILGDYLGNIEIAFLGLNVFISIRLQHVSDITTCKFLGLERKHIAFLEDCSDIMLYQIHLESLENCHSCLCYIK